MSTDRARLFHEALAILGDSADAVALAELVRRLEVGLPLEDEFSVICAWLGRCELLHKLDQLQVPLASKLDYVIPDLLAKFSTQTGAPPFLIEVKSWTHRVLSFKPDYIRRLQNYADLLGLPLLIAWKFHGLWMLFEVSHMKKAKSNFNISVETATCENLLGALAGDVAYKIAAGAVVEIRLRKDRLEGTEQTSRGAVEQWATTIDDVAFVDHEGVRRIDLDRDVQALFSTWDLTEEELHTSTHVQFRFVADGDRIQFAHMALVRLLNWESPHAARPHWRHLLGQERVTATLGNFSSALDRALEQRVVTHVFHLFPRTMAAFLSPPPSFGRQPDR